MECVALDIEGHHLSVADLDTLRVVSTSKWNKIEHRLLCHITQTWRGTPLINRETVIELIASTTTKAGLTVRCELDTLVPHVVDSAANLRFDISGSPEMRRDRETTCRKEIHRNAQR